MKQKTIAPVEVVSATGTAGLQKELADTLIRSVGKHPSNATSADWFQALAAFTRGRMAGHWLATKGMSHRRDVKSVYYLSLEFLIGRSLKSHLLNLGIEPEVRHALANLGVDLDTVAESESDAALGNGGLGRLAACFLDSLTTLGYPACGYGIRYDHGMFAQKIVDGWQVEEPETWLQNGNPWEYPRPNVRFTIGFGGEVAHQVGKAHWLPAGEVQAIAYDLQVSGFRQEMVNTIRLWSARAPNDVDLGHFNQGDHVGAVRDRAESEALSRVLYPDDSGEKGRELRLRQEYFFVAASLADILGRYCETHPDFDELPNKIAIQLNDTHPALAVAELMRLLVDENGLSWDHAWPLVTGVFAYTNHTLLPEALETWSVELLGRLLPRHLEIIYQINDWFLKLAAERFPEDRDLLRRVSLIDEAGGRRVRMAHLAFVGSHKVNGVSELHTQIMRESTFADFQRLFPDRILCKTNGITARRWLTLSNPRLSTIITGRLGPAWPSALDCLHALRNNCDDAGFREQLRAAKAANKARLAAHLERTMGLDVDPGSLFDIQVKRIHEYKRQLLNLLHVVTRYNRIRDGRTSGLVPRTVIFGGKAATSYRMAKLIIKLINDVARTVNADPVASDWLRVAFVPNYSVSLAEVIIPAADLSEQVSTAGAEASGTGNMKFALNGALTVGTRDGANIEIGEAVGEDNIFFFGLTAEAVAARQREGYEPRPIYESDAELRRAVDMIVDGAFSTAEDRDAHRAVMASLMQGDQYMLFADYRAYVETQLRVDAAFTDTDDWTRKSIVNIASMGRFSSDRTIRGYAEEIWQVGSFCLLPEADAGAAAASQRRSPSDILEQRKTESRELVSLAGS